MSRTVFSWVVWTGIIAFCLSIWAVVVYLIVEFGARLMLQLWTWM